MKKLIIVLFLAQLAHSQEFIKYKDVKNIEQYDVEVKTDTMSYVKPENKVLYIVQEHKIRSDKESVKKYIVRSKDSIQKLILKYRVKEFNNKTKSDYLVVKKIKLNVN